MAQPGQKVRRDELHRLVVHSARPEQIRERAEPRVRVNALGVRSSLRQHVAGQLALGRARVIGGRLRPARPAKKYIGLIRVIVRSQHNDIHLALEATFIASFSFSAATRAKPSTSPRARVLLRSSGSLSMLLLPPETHLSRLAELPDPFPEQTSGRQDELQFSRGRGAVHPARAGAQSFAASAPLRDIISFEICVTRDLPLKK